MSICCNFSSECLYNYLFIRILFYLKNKIMKRHKIDKWSQIYRGQFKENYRFLM